jgi:hypothetical protein
MCNEVNETVRETAVLWCWYYWWDMSMKYAIEIGSDAMILLQSFIKNDSGFQKFMVSIYMQTHRQKGDAINRLLFF